MNLSPAIRPAWLRPTALALIVAAHSTAFLTFKPDVVPAPPLESMEVGLVALGESDADQKPQEEIAPAAPPPAEAASAAAPPELTAPPPQIVAPEAPPLPVAKPTPPKLVAKLEDQPDPTAERRKRELAQKRRQEREEEREEAIERRRAQDARAEARRGAAHGAQHANGMSPSAYAGLVVAELNRKKFFPAAARAAGITGSVGVAFTIGPSGRVVSQSITRSSGNGALDGAAHAILSSLHTPPPPGGRFSTATSIRFNLR
ncbi:TonB family protein [Rhodoblastus acidophilus]|uniref:TonB family protein n=1 Tax=Rhodoblastus acidophilus TaxID=1074 RepID=A0A6N8DUU0_RHOAC|nr:energy transducer TonB [Rhodoblastus acidophilus]MCW2275930.1 protein TonB [Rhodoblastus acidophilus]MTV32604.1 TonB family protein [Rhodoblastus acidophilus]